MKIAVVGASGVAGRLFVPLAREQGHDVRAERADLFDAAALNQLFEGCEAVVNLATSIPRPGGRGDWVVNDRIRREGTANLLAAASQCKVRTVIQQSVAMLHCAADDRAQNEEDPIVGYGAIASAADLEGLVRASTMDVRLVRGGQFYGADSGAIERWTGELGSPGFAVPGDGKAWTSPVHVADFAAAILCVLEHGAPHGVYIACDDEPVQLDGLYAAIARRVGVAVPPTGGAIRLRSFRASNRRLCGIGWRPRVSLLDFVAGRA